MTLTHSLSQLLHEASPARHVKAVSRLNDGSLTVTLTDQTSHAICATVRNGTGAAYTVRVTDRYGVCDCPDFSYRSVTCYHQCAVAAFCLQLQDAEAQRTHLMFRNGDLLCSEPQPLKVWRYPWPESIIAHQAQWPEVELCQACVTARYSQHPMKSAA